METLQWKNAGFYGVFVTMVVLCQWLVTAPLQTEKIACIPTSGSLCQDLHGETMKCYLVIIGKRRKKAQRLGVSIVRCRQRVNTFFGKVLEGSVIILCITYPS